MNMTDRIVQIESPCRLSARDEQLVVMGVDGEERTVPFEDLSFLLVDNPGATFTAAVVDGVTRYGAVMAVCDASHCPASITMPLHANTVQTERFRLQLSLGMEEKDAIWDDIVRSKIRNQAALLDSLSLGGGDVVRGLAEGDGPSVREGAAADVYWRRLFGKRFRRDRFGAGPNPLLNYGYAVLRSATVKALLCAGLHPCFSLHHRNRYDDFPLADDVMEPFRVFVDREVYRLWGDGVLTTDKVAKEMLVAVLLSEVRSGGRVLQLANALAQTASSLVTRMRNEEVLVLPEIC